jgi:hypothetical protein
MLMSDKNKNFCSKYELEHNAWLQNKYVTDKHLNKIISNDIVINICPYCDYICKAKSNTDTEKVCILKSTESCRVWIRITNTRPKVEAGKTYGKVKAVYLKYKDNYGNHYWECIRNGKIVIIRSQEILRGDNVGIVSKRNQRYIGSSTNPDKSRHVFATEHSSRIGCAVEQIVMEDIEGEPKPKKSQQRAICKCGGTMRYEVDGIWCDRCRWDNGGE